MHPSSMNGGSSAHVGGVFNAAAGGSVDDNVDDDEVTSSRMPEAPEPSSAFPKSHQVVDVQALRPLVSLPAIAAGATGAGAAGAGSAGAGELAAAAAEKLQAQSQSQAPPYATPTAYPVSSESQPGKMEAEGEVRSRGRAESVRSKGDSCRDSVRSRGSKDTHKGGSGVMSVRMASGAGSHASLGMHSSLYRSLGDTQDFKQFREADAMSAELAACEDATRAGSSMLPVSGEDEEEEAASPSRVLPGDGALAAPDASSLSYVPSTEPHAWWQNAQERPALYNSELDPQVRVFLLFSPCLRISRPPVPSPGFCG